MKLYKDEVRNIKMLKVFLNLLKEVKEFNKHLNHSQAVALTSLILKEESQNQKPTYTEEQYEADFKRLFRMNNHEIRRGLNPNSISLKVSSAGNQYIHVVNRDNPYHVEATDKYGRTDHYSSNSHVEFFIWGGDEELLQELKEIARTSIKVRQIGQLWNCKGHDGYIKMTITADKLKENMNFYFGNADF